MILIWGLQKPHFKGKKSQRQELSDMRRRAVILLEELADAKERVIVPAVAVAEVLCGISVTEHGSFLAELQGNFFLPPFDLRAASLAAELWQKFRALPPDQQSTERAVLKADVQIVATAKVAGADKFFSHERSVRKLAELAGMSGVDLPTHAQDMFKGLEAKRRAKGQGYTANDA